MKYELAESILKSTMSHWDLIKMAEETRNIQIISEIKYDDYQQFTHGMRYVESLALWMRQFKNQEEKDCAYDLVKNNLIYVSEEEMRQLISYSYPMIMKKYLLERTRRFCTRYSIQDVEERKRIYRYFRRSSLFLGLSDGAHIDFFRRQNPELSNEQIFVHYDFSDAKAEDMKKELRQDMQIVDIARKYGEFLSSGFSSFFLIDDFTGSGISYIRKESDGWHGKINKFFDQLDNIECKGEEAEIHLILYVATNRALEHIKAQIKEYIETRQGLKITIDGVQIVDPLDWQENEVLSILLKKNYEECLDFKKATYVDNHFKKGEGKYPYYGFADCSLPLILYHNTPNNSLPVLWYSWEDAVNALFPRITRHKEN